VTKGVPAPLVQEAFRLGAGDVAESRIQEAEPKIALVGAGPRWHFIGHLQTNKAKRAVALFEEIHSVDSARLADEISRRASEQGRLPLVYVEMNTSDNASKHGVSPGDAPGLIGHVAALPCLRLAGLMTIGPLEGGAAGARKSFRLLRRIRDGAMGQGLLPAGAGLSMGMSDDFEIALEEGATVVRVGSALFDGLGPAGA
jgi:PLP dependent protein